LSLHGDENLGQHLLR
jgi:hypothetical protein